MQGCSTCVQRFSLQPTSSICQICLGILQADFKQLAQQAFSQLKGYEKSTKYSLQVAFPPQLSIRTHKIKSHVSLKELFKQEFIAKFSDVCPLEFDIEAPLSLNIQVTHSESQKDYDFLASVNPKFKLKVARKKDGSVVYHTSNDKVAQALGELDEQGLDQLPMDLSTLPLFKFEFFHAPIFVAGRYCKLMRGISNSPWFVGGRKLTPDSIEELVVKELQPLFESCSHKFASAGREDADVLMLGRGRPFYFEMINPKTFPTQQQLMEAMKTLDNEKTKIFDLQIVSKQDTWALKNSASTKSKSYVCIVKPLDKVELKEIQTPLELEQRNPTRVPRRADLVRNKVIEDIHLEMLPDGNIKVDLKTSAGTYVKEFVHGDDGRTVPSLSSILGVPCQVVSLDVASVDLDWPPQIHEE